MGADNKADITNRGGNNGTIAGVVINNEGVSADQVVAIVNNILSQYKTEANQIAIEREQRMENALFDVLKNSGSLNLDGLSALADPGAQDDLHEAFKGYIRSGQEGLESLLSSLIERRCHTKKRDLLQINLSQSIKILPNLLPEEINTLALLFVTRKCVCALDDPTFANLACYLKACVVPLVKDVCKSAIEFEHMASLSCISIHGEGDTLLGFLLNDYPHVFHVPFFEEDVKGNVLRKHPSFFIPCPWDNTKLQVIPVNRKAFEQKLHDEKVSAEESEILHSLYSGHSLDCFALEKIMRKEVPEFQVYLDYCHVSHGFLSSDLLSSGTIIGALRAEELSQKKFDLQTWMQ